MKRLIVLLLGLCILLTACAAPAAPPQPAPTAVAKELPETKDSPTAIASATATLLQPASTLSSASLTDTPTAQPSAQPTTAPLPTQTLLPQPEQWRWGYDNISSSIIAMSLSGEVRKLAPIDQEVAYNAWLISVDSTRGLYFSAVNGQLRVYLLTPEAMAEISMPETYPHNPEIFPGDTKLIHVYGSQIAFAFVVTDAAGSYPSDGPLFLVDSNTLTAKLIDPRVYFSPNLDVRSWIFSPADGRIIRYTSASGKRLEIRELDMQSGQVNTILTSSGSPYGTAASPAGDLWYLSKTGTIQDLAQNQKEIAKEVSFFRPVDREQGIVLPNQCTDKCALQVTSPFGESAVKHYTLNTLACWFTLPDDSYAFSRFDPASGKKTPLAEHLMLLENLP